MPEKTPIVHRKGLKRTKREEEKKEIRGDLPDRKPRIPKKKDNATQTSLKKQ